MNKDIKNEIREKWQDFRYVDFGLSLDLILNLLANEVFDFGIFGGVSADYHYFLNLNDVTSYLDDFEGVLSKHMLNFGGRIGVTTLLARHHRFEFVGKLPIASVNVAGGNGAKLGGFYSFARTTFGGSYKFVF